MYQKSFVELFLAEDELVVFEKRAAEEEALRKKRGEGEEGLIKYYAGNRKGEYRTNTNPSDVNVVTWGVFGAKDIVTTTMIEEMSFKAWRVRSPFMAMIKSATTDQSLLFTGGGFRDLGRMVTSLSARFAVPCIHSESR